MPKKSYKQPESLEDIIHEMKCYCESKQIRLSDYWIKYMAEDCKLWFDSRGWKGITYWPAIAKRWVLTNSYKYVDKSQSKPISKEKGKTIRDKLLEENDEI